ncbi:MAG: lipopolysaccharide export system ATP-binding protein [Oceanospirillaceae bacterium]|jgi:lipopolysaccharide export system ATP-binding protein
MLLTASHLAKSYKRRPVVRDVSIKIASGEVIGLLGPNGAGKTTCFYMIVGLIKSDAGKITLDDLDLTALPMHERARKGIGYLPQEPSIFRKLSVENNLLGILEMRKDLNRAQQKQKMESLLEEFHITHIRHNTGMSLSGGERRRVEIARALATEPKFILLDEPFAGVDPISVNDIKQTILHLQSKGIGILITDHNVRETLDICEKAYIVHDGFILASGEPHEIMENEQVKSAYLGDKFSL